MTRHRPAPMQTDHFLPYDGSGCPVSGKVRVRFRNGTVALIGPEVHTWAADPWVWCDPPSGFDVVAYEGED